MITITQSRLEDNVLYLTIKDQIKQEEQNICFEFHISFFNEVLLVMPFDSLSVWADFILKALEGDLTSNNKEYLKGNYEKCVSLIASERGREKFEGPFYYARLNIKGRFFFQIKSLEVSLSSENETKQVFLVLPLLIEHNHKLDGICELLNARSFATNLSVQRLLSSLKERLVQIPLSHLTNKTPLVEVKKPLSPSSRPLFIYRQDISQEKVLHKTLPFFLTGQAGTGKTFVTLRYMAQFARKNPTAKILYVTLSPSLVEQSKRFWQDHGERAPQINADFKTYEEVQNSYFCLAFNFVCSDKPPQKTEPYTVYLYLLNPGVLEYLIQYTHSMPPKKGRLSKQQMEQNKLAEIMGNFGKKQFSLSSEQKNSLENLLCPRAKRKANWQDFQSFFEQKNLPLADKERMFKEFRGVFLNQGLSLEEYLSLGARNSLFSRDEREKFFPIFQAYLTHLMQEGAYEPSFLAWQQYLKGKLKIYDMIAIDEAQDLSSIQLLALLKLLKKESQNQFLIAGDAHQAIGDNYFTWSSQESALYHESQLKQIAHFSLTDNHRQSGVAIFSLSHNILRFLHRVYGAPDKKFSVLDEIALPGNLGVPVVPLSSELLQRISQFAQQYPFQVGVIVLTEAERDKLRSQGMRCVIFTVQEAKGLEFPAVFLINAESSKLELFKQIKKDDQSIEESTTIRNSQSKEKLDNPYLLKQTLHEIYTGVTRAIEKVFLTEEAFDEIFLWKRLKSCVIEEKPSESFWEPYFAPLEGSDEGKRYLLLINLLHSDSPGSFERSLDLLSTLKDKEFKNHLLAELEDLLKKTKLSLKNAFFLIRHIAQDKEINLNGFHPKTKMTALMAIIQHARENRSTAADLTPILGELLRFPWNLDWKNDKGNTALTLLLSCAFENRYSLKDIQILTALFPSNHKPMDLPLVQKQALIQQATQRSEPSQVLEEFKKLLSLPVELIKPKEEKTILTKQEPPIQPSQQKEKTEEILARILKDSTIRQYNLKETIGYLDYFLKNHRDQKFDLNLQIKVAGGMTVMMSSIICALKSKYSPQETKELLGWMLNHAKKGSKLDLNLQDFDNGMTLLMFLLRYAMDSEYSAESTLDLLEFLWEKSKKVTINLNLKNKPDGMTTLMLGLHLVQKNKYKADPASSLVNLLLDKAAEKCLDLNLQDLEKKMTLPMKVINAALNNQYSPEWTSMVLRLVFNKAQKKPLDLNLKLLYLPSGQDQPKEMSLIQCFLVYFEKSNFNADFLIDCLKLISSLENKDRKIKLNLNDKETLEYFLNQKISLDDSKKILAFLKQSFVGF